MFQTALYRAVYIDNEFGWDADPVPLFESGINTDPTIVMQELDFFEPTHSNWFATMKVFGTAIEEEWFDSSVVDVEY